MACKVTVIGGSGFVGTNLCRQLAAKKQDFEILDLKMSNQFPNKCKIADVRDLNSLRHMITGNVVVNLAAVHRDDIRDKDEYHLTNTLGAQNVANICTELSIKKIIFTSTVAVYGFADTHTDENGTIKPFNEYGRTKYAAEEILRAWQSKNDNALIIVRPTVIFGEGNRGNVYNLINQIFSRKFLMVGHGRNKKSMAYIKNVVSFLEQCIVTEKVYGVYNYVDGPDLTMNELVLRIRQSLHGKNGIGLGIPYWLGVLIGVFADFIFRMTGKKLPVSLIRIKKFASNSSFKSAKEDLDNFIAPFSLIDGLERTLYSEFLYPDTSQEIFLTE